ncbi:MAG: FtsX-like permease family protein, partial [Patescibacteria group bacterium]
YGGKGDIIEEVVYQKDVVDALISWSNAIKVIGGVLAGLLAVDALLIVMTVIGMKIALRRDEIEILKLVGASSWYIRLPFLWEGALYGIWGATASWAVLIGVLVWMRPVLLSFLEAIPVFVTVLSNPTSTIFLAGSAALLGILLVTGFLLGIIGSAVSVGRYLKF